MSVISRAAIFIRGNVYALTSILFLIVYWNVVKFNFPLPFVDLIGFSYLSMLPTGESFGEHYYYTFQFTYILGHIIFRVLGDLHLKSVTALHVANLLQYAILWVAVGRITWLMALTEKARIVAVLLVLIGWIAQTLNVWGGPYFFTLMQCIVFLLFAVLLTTEDKRTPGIAYPVVLAILALAAHPFGLPFILMVSFTALIFNWSRRQLIRISATVAVSLLYTALFVIDHSVGDPPKSLLELLIDVRLLSDLHPLYERAHNIFVWHYNTISGLLATSLLSMRIACLVLAYVTVVGAIGGLALLIMRFSKLLPVEKATLFLSAGSLLYYLVCPENPYTITMWPYRFFVFCALPCALSFVLVSIRVGAFLVEYIDHRYPAARRALSPGIALVMAILFVLPFVALHDLRIVGTRFPLETDKFDSTIHQSNFRDCVLYVTGLENIAPFWLRAVPFSAFLDPVLRQRNVVVFTEWHAVPQHNAKVPRDLLERALGNICTVHFLPSTPTSLNYQLSMTAVKRP